MIKKIPLFRLFIAIIFSLLLFSCAPEEKKTVPVNSSQINTLTLKSLDGKTSSVNALVKNHSATVFYFLMPGCPMCESYTRTVNELDKKFSSNGISFSVVFSSPDYSDEEIISFRKDFKLSLPFYRDSAFVFTRVLGATVTPEVFVLDSTATVLYSGSIDNWAYATGKKRMEATEFFLNDALENIVYGKPVAVKSTTAYGCLIE